jgi:hypothetical protein
MVLHRSRGIRCWLPAIKTVVAPLPGWGGLEDCGPAAPQWRAQWGRPVDSDDSESRMPSLLDVPLHALGYPLVTLG